MLFSISEILSSNSFLKGDLSVVQQIFALIGQTGLSNSLIVFSVLDLESTNVLFTAVVDLVN